MSKGTEALTLVIGLVIGLVIIILVISLISGKIGGFNKATSCTGQGGDCRDRAKPCVEYDENKPNGVTTSDCYGGSYCCLPG